MRKFEEIKENETLPAGAKPYSIDIKSFYNNILLSEGLDAFKEVLDEREDKSIPSEYLIKLRLLMNCNIFKFNYALWVH